MNNPFLSNHPGAIDPIKSSSAKPLAWQGIEEILPPQICRSDYGTFAFSSEFIIFSIVQSANFPSETVF